MDFIESTTTPQTNMSPTTHFTMYDNDEIFNKSLLEEIDTPMTAIYIFAFISAFYLMMMLCKNETNQEKEGSELSETEAQIEGHAESEASDEDNFIIFPDTLKVSDDGDEYTFNKFRSSVMEDGSLHVITGNALKKLEARERRQARKEERERVKEQQDTELISIADESLLRETVSRLQAILENHSTVETQEKRKKRSYIRPLDYGHRYLQDQDQLTTSLRGLTVDVLYRKGPTVKEDRYVAVFAGSDRAEEFNSLNKIAAELARRVTINGPNAWTAFKRVKPNGELESIERLDIIE